MRKLVVLLVLGLAAAGGYQYYQRSRPPVLVLTGIVTTNDVIVSSQIGGQIDKLLAVEGDQVTNDQLVAVLKPDELKADTAYYTHNVEGLSSQVRESEAALRFQERQTVDQIRQAESTLASTEAQVAAATADFENARLTYARVQDLAKGGVVAPQELDQSRTAQAAAQAKVEALKKQVDAQRAAVALARSNAEQITVRRSQVQANAHMQAAASAQRQKADVRLRYTEIHAPIDGIVDVRAVRVGEVVGPGQPIVTLINPDDLWVRVDVEETYIDRIRIGDKVTVRLPSGDEREGAVFYRGIDAGFATQRDVSRTKRDIKTFEVRLRVDNKDRRLAVGMTAYVLLPVSSREGFRRASDHERD
jgi:HlyD family secretion protein